MVGQSSIDHVNHIELQFVSLHYYITFIHLHYQYIISIYIYIISFYTVYIYIYPSISLSIAYSIRSVGMGF